MIYDTWEKLCDTVWKFMIYDRKVMTLANDLSCVKLEDNLCLMREVVILDNDLSYVQLMTICDEWERLTWITSCMTLDGDLWRVNTEKGKDTGWRFMCDTEWCFMTRVMLCIKDDDLRERLCVKEDDLLLERGCV